MNAFSTMSSEIKIKDLCVGEQLIVRAFRTRLAAAKSQDCSLVHGFRLAFGLARVEHALAQFEALFQDIERHLIKDLTFACKCQCQITRDELKILNLFRACQHDEPSDAREIINPIIQAHVRSGLIVRITSFGLVMEEVGLTLPRRMPMALFTQLPSAPAKQTALH